MSEATKEIPIGATGAVRVRAVANVRVKPAVAAQTIDVLTAPLKLAGTCDNLRRSLPCSLTWVFKPDDGGVERKVEHPEKLVLVPEDFDGLLKAKPYELKTQGRTKPEDLHLDLLKLGLVGEGKLGYRLDFDQAIAAPVILSPEESKLRVALRTELELLDLGNNVLRDPSFKVGTQYRVRAKFSPSFAGHLVQVTIREAGAGLAGHPPPATAVTWTLKANPSEAPWSQLSTGLSDSHFDYRLSSRSGDKLEYLYTIAFLSPPEGKKGSRVLFETEPKPLFQLPRPKLESLKLSMAQSASKGDRGAHGASALKESVFRLQGDIRGIEAVHWGASGDRHDFELLLTVQLFAHWVDAGKPNYRAVGVGAGEKVWPLLIKAVGGKIDVELRPISVSNADWSGLVGLDESSLSLFAVVRFSPLMGVQPSKGTPEPPAFADIVAYTPNAAKSPESGLVPMGPEFMGSQANATGVSSNLVDAKGGLVKLTYESSLRTEWPGCRDAATGYKKQNAYDEWIQIFAEERKLAPLALKALIMRESRFNPDAANDVGYAGLTQVSADLTKLSGHSVGETVMLGKGHYRYDRPDPAAGREGDHRFNPKWSIEIGAFALANKQDAMVKFLAKREFVLSESDRMRVVLAAYNIGEGVIQEACLEAASRSNTKQLTWAAICGAGEGSPLWKAIANPKHGYNIAKKYEENSGYVKEIMDNVDAKRGATK